MLNQITIFRGGSPVATVKIDDRSVYTHKLMGEHTVKLIFTSKQSILFGLGDTITHAGMVFTLNLPPLMQKISRREFEYELTFEAPEYTLLKKIMVHLDATDFSYFGNAEKQLELLLDNINLLDAGWSKGLVDQTPSRTILYQNESCRAALRKIADEFGLEFHIENKTIHLKATVGDDAAIDTFEYGKGKGLYTLTREAVRDTQVVTRLYGFGSTRNLPPNYRNGLARLTFAARFLENNVTQYGIIEDAVIFDDVFPQRTGTLTGVDSPTIIEDTTLDFDLNGQLVDGVAKVVFTSGSLEGNEFEILRYDHTSKKITIKPNVEETGYTLPNQLVMPSPGDTYTLIGITMPQSYIDEAEQILQAKTEAELERISVPLVQYEIEIDESYVRVNELEPLIKVAKRLQVIDGDMDINKAMRIHELSYPIAIPSRITVKLSDQVNYTAAERILIAQRRAELEARGLSKIQIALELTNAIRRQTLERAIFTPDNQYIVTWNDFRAGTDGVTDPADPEFPVPASILDFGRKYPGLWSLQGSMIHDGFLRLGDPNDLQPEGWIDSINAASNSRVIVMGFVPDQMEDDPDNAPFILRRDGSLLSRAINIAGGWIGDLQIINGELQAIPISKIDGLEDLVNSLSFNLANIGNGAQVYRDQVSDTYRFRSLVAGAGVSISQQDNYILISTNAAPGGSGQGLTQSPQITLAQNGSTTLVATSIVAVYEFELPIYSYIIRTTPVQQMTSFGGFAIFSRNSAGTTFTSNGNTSLLPVWSTDQYLTDATVFYQHTVSNIVLIAGNSWVGWTTGQTAKNGVVFANPNVPTSQMPDKIILKFRSDVNYTLPNPLTEAAFNALPGFTFTFFPSKIANVEQFFFFPSTIDHWYLAVLAVYNTPTSNAALWKIKPAFITIEQAGDKWVRLNEHADYTVTRVQNSGVQAHTITRLKAGSTSHIIEYITGEESSLDGENIGASGVGVFFVKDHGKLLFKKLVAGDGIDLQDNGTTITITNTGDGIGGGSGEANTASNLPGGTGLFASKLGQDLRFRSLVAGTNVSITSDANTITFTVPAIGEVNTASNLGSGTGVFASKQSTELRFRSLVAGSNVTITSTATEITISATGGSGGEANTASNLGVGIGLFASKVGADLRFRSLVAGSGVSFSNNANTITINATGAGGGEVNDGANLGSWAQVYSGKVGATLQFKTLRPGTNVNITEDATTITFNVPNIGEVNTASNVGGGTGVFASKVGADLRFRSFVPGSGISITTSGDAIVITNTAGGGSGGEANTASNLGAGTGIYAAKVGVDLRFRSLLASGSVSISSDANTITISAPTPGEINTASNLGSGQGVFASKVGADLRFRSIVAGGSVNISSDANTITISAPSAGEVNTASNLGSGTGVFASKQGADLRFRSLLAGSFISITNDSNAITLAYSGPITVTGFTLGQDLTHAGAGNTVFLKGLLAGNGVTIDDNSANINNNTFRQLVINSHLVNAGSAGETLAVLATSGGAHQIKRLLGASGLVVSSTADQVILSGQNFIQAAVNLGNGFAIFEGIQNQNLRFKSLVAGTNVTLSSDANTITINAIGGGSGEVNTGQNIGSGIGVFESKAGTTLRFRALQAGTGISIEPDLDGSLIISATGGGGYTPPAGANTHIQFNNGGSFGASSQFRFVSGQSPILHLDSSSPAVLSSFRANNNLEIIAGNVAVGSNGTLILSAQNVELGSLGNLIASSNPVQVRMMDTVTVRYHNNSGGAEVRQLGFYGFTPIQRPSVTGSRGGNSALTSLLTQLANLGLIQNSTS